MVSLDLICSLVLCFQGIKFGQNSSPYTFYFVVLDLQIITLHWKDRKVKKRNTSTWFSFSVGVLTICCPVFRQIRYQIIKMLTKFSKWYDEEIVVCPQTPNFYSIKPSHFHILCNNLKCLFYNTKLWFNISFFCFLNLADTLRIIQGTHGDK